MTQILCCCSMTPITLLNAKRFGDKRVEYRSEKYPWIEAVYKYPIWAPHPFDYDVIPITIPGFHGVDTTLW